jgi:hypothetical protein
MLYLVCCQLSADCLLLLYGCSRCLLLIYGVGFTRCVPVSGQCGARGMCDWRHTGVPRYCLLFLPNVSKRKRSYW